MRHKEFHGTFINPILKHFLDFALSKMSAKLRKRVCFHTKLDDGKGIENSKGIDVKLLPKEYGGTIPMADMIKSFMVELEAKRDILLSHDHMTVKLELYPEAVRTGSTRSLKTPLSSPAEAFEDKKDMYGLSGVQGSFRKLEID